MVSSNSAMIYYRKFLPSTPVAISLKLRALARARALSCCRTRVRNEATYVRREGNSRYDIVLSFMSVAN